MDNRPPATQPPPAESWFASKPRPAQDAEPAQNAEPAGPGEAEPEASDSVYLLQPPAAPAAPSSPPPVPPRGERAEAESERTMQLPQQRPAAAKPSFEPSSPPPPPLPPRRERAETESERTTQLRQFRPAAKPSFERAAPPSSPPPPRRERAETESERTMQLRTLPEPTSEPDPGYAFAEPVRPGWTLPPVPDVAWSAKASRRRTWISRGLLLALLLVQSVLTLRLSNSAFEDEALYLYAGHAEIAQLFHGAPDYGGFAGYFSGAPTLYPVLAAAVDSLFGLTGVRAMSLLFMLGANGLLYSFTRRLFNERAGLCAAILFAFAQSTLFLGNLATYDAAAVLLLAAATWIVVRVGHGHWALPLLAAPVAALAVGVKYASALYLPTIALLLLLVAYQRHGVKLAVLRTALFTAATGGLLGVALYATGYMTAISGTTTARAHGDTPTWAMIQDSARWGGVLFLVAGVGTALYARRARLSEMPGWRQAVPGARWRLALGLLLTSTALLAPLYQIHLSTSTSLHKHVGFGLLFAAPMAGVGMTRMMGAHFKFPQLGIAISVIALTMGMSQSAKNFGIWPDTTYLVKDLSSKVQPGQRWLGEPHEGPVYYLTDLHRTEYQYWTSVFYIDYTGRKGQHLSGVAGYRAAIQDGWFDGVVLDWSDGSGEVSRAVREEMRTGGKYRLSSALPYRTSAGTGHFEVWLRSTPAPTPAQ